MPILILLFSLLSASACRPEPESIHALSLQQDGEQLNLNTMPDTAAIMRQIVHADSLWKKHPDRAKMLLEDALKNSLGLGYDLGIVRAEICLGHGYYLNAQYDSALIALRKGLQHCAHIAPGECLKEYIYTNMGIVYYSMGNMDSTAIYFYKGVNGLERHDIKSYKRAFSIYKTAGAIWFNEHASKTGQIYNDKAVELALLHKDSTMLMAALSNKAVAYVNRGLLDSAILYNKIVLESKAASIDTRIETAQNMGTLYSATKYKNQPEQAIHYYLTALQLARQTGDSNSSEVIDALFNLGRGYLTLGYKKDKPQEIRKAAPIFSYLNKDKTKAKLSLAYKKYLPYYTAFMYGQLKQYQKAYEQGMVALNLRDSLYKKEKLAIMSKLDVQYRVAEKDKALSAQQLKLARQKNWIIASISALLLLLMTLGFLFKRKKHKEEIRQLKASLKGEEKERLRMAQELHDGIVSRLSAVKLHFATLPAHHLDMEATSDFQEALEQLEDSITELRTTSHNLQPQILQQEGLAGALRIFCKKISRVSPVAVTFQMAGTPSPLEPSFELTIYRIVQELVQNIIKHSGAIHALVQLTARENWLSISIDDDGKGIPDGQLHATNGNGIGLLNLRERVKILKGSLSIESTSGKGTSVYLEFDLKKIRL